MESKYFADQRSKIQSPGGGTFGSEASPKGLGLDFGLQTLYELYARGARFILCDASSGEPLRKGRKVAFSDLCGLVEKGNFGPVNMKSFRLGLIPHSLSLAAIRIFKGGIPAVQIICQEMNLNSGNSYIHPGIPPSSYTIWVKYAGSLSRDGKRWKIIRGKSRTRPIEGDIWHKAACPLPPLSVSLERLLLTSFWDPKAISIDGIEFAPSSEDSMTHRQMTRQSLASARTGASRPKQLSLFSSQVQSPGSEVLAPPSVATGRQK